MKKALPTGILLGLMLALALVARWVSSSDRSGR